MLFIKIAGDKVTSRDIKNFEDSRRPSRDAAVGALVGSGVGIPGALLGAGIYRASAGKGQFKNGLKVAAPASLAVGALLGAGFGSTGHPHFAHPIDSIKDNEKRKKHMRVYNEYIMRKAIGNSD